MFYPEVQEYLEMSNNYNLVPVYTELLADMDTPISIFKKVCSDAEGYLLESVEGGEHLARYSFIGFDPFLRYKCSKEKGVIEEPSGSRSICGEPLDVLQNLMSGYRAPDINGLPRFYGGAVGYFGYDLVRSLEQLPEKTGDDLSLPDCYFMLTRLVLIFDHVKHKVKIVVNTLPGIDPLTTYHEAVSRIHGVIGKINNPPDMNPSFDRNVITPVPLESNMTKEEFMHKVASAQEYIKAGDIFQVVLSQRLKMPLEGKPLDIYRNLRTLNPAPYLYYLAFGEITLIGSSPEMLIRVEDGRVQTCPIAGTRPRGATVNEDVALEADLLNDPKEKAEHLMLVDLGRNDLGRVCDYGSIEVSGFMEVQKYSHVMHMVSTVTGTLRKGQSSFNALKACFPAGTVSGAPKIRAMEIIEELEPTRRGIYAGVIGYFGFTGNIDTCITIRTILVHGGIAYVQTGAGIVADSDPEKEYEETINKAKALLETLMLKEVG